MITRWNQFWYEERSTQSLCLLRIFFGAVFIMKMTGFGNLQYPFRWFMEFPVHKFYDEIDYYLHGFHLPVPGFEWLPVLDLWQYQILDYMLLIAGVLFTIGILTRPSAWVITVIWSYQFFVSQFSYRHHIMLFLIVMTIFAFSRCDEHYSLKAYLRGPDSDRPKRSILPIRMVQVLVTIIYFFGFSGKLNPSWFSGDIMLAFYDQGSIAGDFVTLLDLFFSIPLFSGLMELFYRSLAWFTLVVEGGLVIGLWLPKWRRLSLALGLLLHLGIDLTMNVSTFSFEMFAVYLAFILPESGQHTVFYRGDNAKQGTIKRWASLFDWFQRFTWVDVCKEGTEADRMPSDLRSIQITGCDGVVRTGKDAFIWFCACCPLLFLASWPMMGLRIIFHRRSST